MLVEIRWCGQGEHHAVNYEFPWDREEAGSLSEAVFQEDVTEPVPCPDALATFGSPLPCLSDAYIDVSSEKTKW